MVTEMHWAKGLSLRGKGRGPSPQTAPSVQLARELYAHVAEPPRVPNVGENGRYPLLRAQGGNLRIEREIGTSRGRENRGCEAADELAPRPLRTVSCRAILDPGRRRSRRRGW